MTLNTVKEILCTDVHTCEALLDQDVAAACGSDLMSDVLAFSSEKVLLLTGLLNPQVIRTAEMMDIKAVVFLRGKSPTPEMLELAKDRSIVLMTTSFPMFRACGLLYKSGLGGDEV